MGLLDRFREDKEPKPDVAPRSTSGRGHTEGFIVYEETNPDLIGVPGLAIFDKMYRTDGDVRQALALVANPLVAGTWDIEPHGGPEADQAAIEDAEFVKWALWDIMDPNFNGHLEEMLPILLRSGFAPFEELWTTAKWDKDGKEYLVLRRLDLRLPRTIWRWFQDDFGDLHSIVQSLPVPKSSVVYNGTRKDDFKTQRKASNGELLNPGEVELSASQIVYYRIGKEGDNWEGTSILRPAYKHFLMKDGIERIDAIAQEREAVGVPICYPPMGATPRQLDEIEDVLSSMRSNEQGYVVMPGPKAGAGATDGTGWLIEIIGYDRSTAGRDPQPSLAYHTQKIYASVIAEFMRLGHGQTGARATAEVQADPYLQSIEALSRGMENQLQKLVNKIIAYNRPKAKASPRIKLSKVDSTSLTQLADYVMKLAQAGALLPDKRLETYLRNRADLPPMDPDAIKARGTGDTADTDLRKEVLTGGGQFGDAMGGNQSGGGSGKATPKSSNKTKPSKKLSDSYSDEKGRRLRHRAYRPEEEHLNLDGVEDYLDEQPNIFAIALQDLVVDYARTRIMSTMKLNRALEKCLDDLYLTGVDDVHMEVGSMLNSPTTLNIRDNGHNSIWEMSKHASKQIKDRMDSATEAARLNTGDAASMQLAAETEGLRALRAVALGHGSSAYQLGRSDGLKTLSVEHPELRFMYTSMLDNRVCTECEQADDGIPRAWDDPVRLANRPPNAHCLSNLSGHNYCRCIEVPVVV
jgi:hypothetical protein